MKDDNPKNLEMDKKHAQLLTENVSENSEKVNAKFTSVCTPNFLNECLEFWTKLGNYGSLA